MPDSAESAPTFAGTGTSRLMLDPTAEPRVCESTLRAELVAGTRFTSVSIVWSYAGTPQRGALLLGPPRGVESAVEAAWIGSWHMRDEMMRCLGHRAADGTISVRGSYAAPPGPDWGWQIDLRIDSERTILCMFNISPAGDESRAVEAEYAPRS